jgi:hypothetical protein
VHDGVELRPHVRIALDDGNHLCPAAAACGARWARRRTVGEFESLESLGQIRGVAAGGWRCGASGRYFFSIRRSGKSPAFASARPAERD